jgi:YD repeat-containing protein
MVGGAPEVEMPAISVRSLVCVLLLVAFFVAPPATLATPVTSAANVAQSGISPGGVDMATGELILVMRPDLVLDGPLPVMFKRYYASMLAREGLASGSMGPNWLGPYDWRLNLGGTAADVITDRGADIHFQSVPGGGWALVSPLDHAYVLMSAGASLRFTDPVARRIYVFGGTPPQLTQIVDEHGNALDLTYTGGSLTQVSDGLGRVLTFAYDRLTGMLGSITDGTRTVSYSYTGGVLTGFTDAGGRHWTFGYVQPGPIQGLLTGVTEPLENTPLSQTYDPLGRVVSQMDARGGVANYVWDGAAGGVFTDPLGRSWTYLHDAQNRLVSLTDPNSGVWSRAYDASGRIASETRPLGDGTSFGYDGASGYPAMAGFADGSAIHWTYGSHLVGGSTLYDLAGAQYPDLTTESFTRDPAGNLVTFTDRGGGLWQGTYNPQGQLLTGTNPAGGVTTLTYNTAGRLASESDPAGVLTRYTYDALSRLVAIAPDDTSSRTYAYDPLDHVTSAIDERGAAWDYTYDADGRLINDTNPLFESTQYSYDGLDRLTQVTDPLGEVSAYAYDGGGRVSSFTDGTGRVTRYAYDAWGDLSGTSDPAGATWSYGYDSNRRATNAQDPLTHAAAYAYDAVDRLTHSTDPVGTGFDYGYDAMDRLQTATGPLGRSLTLGYDARGLLTSLLDATSRTDLARNSLGEVSQLTDPNRNPWPSGYDTGGRLTSAADPLGRTSSYDYDARGRLIHGTLPLGAASLQYDRADRLVGESFADGTALSWSYDDANRLTGATGATYAYDAAGHRIASNGLSFTYDAAGRITTETYGEGRAVSYTYDARGLLSQVSDWMGGVTTFTYDAAGRMTGITRPNGTTGTYAYDAADRLVNAVEVQPGPINSPISSIAITRDAVGEPSAVVRAAPLLPSVLTPGTTNFGYDAASQVTGFVWDGLGRLLGDGSRTFAWDGASRLTQYNAAGENPSFTYDGFGRLLSRTQGAAAEQYAWNDANDAPTLDVVMNGPSPVRYFVHTPSGLLLESIEAAGGARRYYHYDEDGNTLFLTDDTGAVVAAYAYGPFGDVRSSGSTAGNPFTLGGGAIQLGGSGLFAFPGGDVYDSKLARMISGGATGSGPPDIGTSNPGPQQRVTGQPGPNQRVEANPGPINCVETNPGPNQRVETNPGPQQRVTGQPGPNQLGTRIRGIQTAVVVGAGEEEIFVDEYGRIKVQFNWDRKGKNDVSDGIRWRESLDHALVENTITIGAGTSGPGAGKPSFDPTIGSAVGKASSHEGPRESVSITHVKLTYEGRERDDSGQGSDRATRLPPCKSCVQPFVAGKVSGGEGAGVVFTINHSKMNMEYHAQNGPGVVQRSGCQWCVQP